MVGVAQGGFSLTFSHTRLQGCVPIGNLELVPLSTARQHAN
jgi:hypothetical protein